MNRNEWTLVASRQLPDGLWMTLRHRRLSRQGGVTDGYKLEIAGCTLMEVPAATESARKLAEVTVPMLAEKTCPWVLIGGLGFGLTLGASLDLLPKTATVIVSELYPEIVTWNREHLYLLEGHRLGDGRVRVEVEDVAARIAKSESQFDAILLDVDNGPKGFHRKDNDWLYAPGGLDALHRALTNGGIVGVWSAFEDSGFERRLMSAGLGVRKFTAQSRLENAVIYVGRKMR